MGNENVTLAAVTEDKPQIVGAFPQIIVTGTAEKPYYETMYLEFADGEVHVGYSSYDLGYVFRCLKEYFGETRARVVDPESLRPKGRLEFKYIIDADYYSSVPAWFCKHCGWHIRDKGGKPKPPKMNYCPNCGAKMEG